MEIERRFKDCEADEGEDYQGVEISTPVGGIFLSMEKGEIESVSILIHHQAYYDDLNRMKGSEPK